MAVIALYPLSRIPWLRGRPVSPEVDCIPLYLQRAVVSDNVLNGMLLIVKMLAMCHVSFVCSHIPHVVLNKNYTISRWQHFLIPHICSLDFIHDLCDLRNKSAQALRLLSCNQLCPVLSLHWDTHTHTHTHTHTLFSERQSLLSSFPSARYSTWNCTMASSFHILSNWWYSIIQLYAVLFNWVNVGTVGWRTAPRDGSFWVRIPVWYLEIFKNPVLSGRIQ